MSATTSMHASPRSGAITSTASCNGGPRPALDRGRVWWVAQPLDVEAMHAAAQSLLGNHDFTTFRSAQCQARSPVRTLDRLDVSRDGEEWSCGRRRDRSCTIRCARWSARSHGRRRQMERRRSRPPLCRARPRGVRAGRAARWALSRARGLLIGPPPSPSRPEIPRVQPKYRSRSAGTPP